MEDLGDRQERPVDNPGMKHEISGLEGLKDLLRPCSGLDRLADKQAAFDCVYFHSNAKHFHLLFLY